MQAVEQVPLPGARPQKTVEDLEAEYLAWIQGVFDTHDEAIAQYKAACWQRLEGVDHPCKMHFDPEGLSKDHVTEDGKCICETNMNRLEGTLRCHLKWVQGRISDFQKHETYLKNRLQDIARARADHPEASPEALPSFGYHHAAEKAQEG